MRVGVQGWIKSQRGSRKTELGGVEGRSWESGVMKGRGSRESLGGRFGQEVGEVTGIKKEA